MRIRIIDDAPGLAASLAALLTDYGHVAIPTTADFEALLTPLAWVGIDAALLDLQLNNAVSGLVIADWLAAHAPTVHVVVLTGAIDARRPAIAAITLLKPAPIGAVLAALEER